MTYLDHAATTPVVPAALKAMIEASGVVGNASALHSAGRSARRIVEESRERIAAAVGCLPGEVVFTSGGTEADNLAVKGLAWSRRAADPERRRILTSAIEHHAVLDPAAWMQRSQGFTHQEIPVDGDGVLSLRAMRELVDSDPASIAVVSTMSANNEVGSRQPIQDVARIVGVHGIPLHVDAVQSFGIDELDFTDSAISAMTISAHKLGGPVGVGALVLRRELTPQPVLHGGGQERDIRSGTIAMPLIAGFAAAVDAAMAERDAARVRMTALRDRLIEGVLALDCGAVMRGHATDRLPGNAHFTFTDCEGDALLMLLDAHGVQVSTGSACTAGIPQPSHVLLAMGITDADARGALRFSLGRNSTDADVDALLAALPMAVDRARKAGLMR